MVFAKNNTSSLKNLKILRPKVTQSFRIWVKKFCESRPWDFVFACDLKSLNRFFVLVFGISSQRRKIKIYQTKENKKVFRKKKLFFCFCFLNKHKKICFCHFDFLHKGTKLLSSESVAWIIIFLYRPFFYDEDSIKTVSLTNFYLWKELKLNFYFLNETAQWVKKRIQIQFEPWKYVPHQLQHQKLTLQAINQQWVLLV
jgi:hypothetical protein